MSWMDPDPAVERAMQVVQRAGLGCRHEGCRSCAEYTATTEVLPILAALTTDDLVALLVERGAEEWGPRAGGKPWRYDGRTGHFILRVKAFNARARVLVIPEEAPDAG